ncbi:MAG: carboxypeptidase-like regulatory domain-containing protein, partial [Candidatus Sulfotelmatobacter sp.]
MLRRAMTARVLIAVCAVLLASSGQAQNPRGSLRGTVQDATGARVASAKIVVQAVDSSLRREVLSEDRGEFRLDDLLPGACSIAVTAAGFAPAQASVIIAVATVRDVTVTMEPAAIQQTVNVQAVTSSITTQTIELASAVHQGVVGSQDLEALPLPARSFANIAYLVPGTEPVEPSDPTKARITAVSTGGSSGLNNELSVDGADNSDDWIGGFLQNLSPDGIQEFAVR